MKKMPVSSASWAVAPGAGFLTVFMVACMIASFALSIAARL